MNLHSPAELLHGRHHYAVRVYYEDTDAGGVAYHASYLRFAERGRTEALRSLGVPHGEMTSQHGVMFMVRRVKVDYLSPALLDEQLVVITEPVAIRAAAMELRQRVVRMRPPERDLAVLEIQLACVRLADQRPARLPVRWREALLAMLRERVEAPIGARA
jgi:acyl-CoA thioester hydrolase